MHNALYQSEPGIFIRSLSIYRAYPDGLLRTIPFDTGLNIVAGDHNSGKTTLYRFLRYLLGDKEYAEKNIKTVIKTKLPDGGLLGRVVINSETWAVWRPFDSRIDWGDSAAKISDDDDSSAIDLDAASFAKYIAALENSARGFSEHPSFVGAPPLSWNDLLNLYTRDEKSYGDSLYSWVTHAYGKAQRLPVAKKDCWSFLLKLFGANIADRDVAITRLSDLESCKTRIEEEVEESKSRQQKDIEYAESLLRDAVQDLKNRFQIIDDDSGMYNTETMISKRLRDLRDQHDTALKKIKSEAVSHNEADKRLKALEEEKDVREKELLRLEDASKDEERALHNAQETLTRIKQRIADRALCDDGLDFVNTCKAALKVTETLPQDIIKRAGWIERNEAKEAEDKQKIRARIQELKGEIAAARAQASKALELLAKAEGDEQTLNENIEQLTSVIDLRARAKRLEKTIQEKLKAEAGYAERVEQLAQIHAEVEQCKSIVQNQDTHLKESLGEVNADLTHAVKQYFGPNATASLELRKDGLDMMLHDGISGGGYTFDTVLRPLILDWLTVSYGAAGKSPHHAFFVQDSPFQGEMQVPLQKAYLEMVLSLSAEYRHSYQQIVLTSSAGSDGINPDLAHIERLTPDLAGRLLPGIELSLQRLALGADTIGE